MQPNDDNVKLPLTERLEHESHNLWLEREFATAILQGVPFTTHRDWWHYLLGGNRIVSLKINMMTGAVQERREATAKDRQQWIEEARRLAA